jgi:predicted MFS family arabinose efflux permease
VAILFAVYGVHRGALRAVGKALAVDLAPRELRASGIGIYGAALGLSALVAGVGAGVLWDRFGSQTTFVVASVLAASGTLLLAVLVPASRTSSLDR